MLLEYGMIAGGYRVEALCTGGDFVNYRKNTCDICVRIEGHPEHLSVLSSQ